MMIAAEFESFVTPYHAKNGNQVVNANPLALARAMTVVGYQGIYDSINEVGPLRAISMIAMAGGFFSGALQTTAAFDSLESTEKVGVTFLAASGLTLLAAEQHLDMRHLLHFRSWKSAKAVKSGSTAVSKSTLVLSEKSKSKPDFVGYDRAGNTHILESKGRSAASLGFAQHSDQTLQKALAQVSRVGSVRSVPPATRVACLWSFASDGVTGRVVDPEEEVEVVDLQFDPVDAFLRSYAAIVGDWFEASQRPVGDGFVGVEIVKGVNLIVDDYVFQLLRFLRRGNGGLGVIDEFLSIPGLEERMATSSDRSVGANGVGLMVDELSPFFKLLSAT